MADRLKIQKLLNLCSSANDDEALAALRLVQKMTTNHLGDFLFSLNQAPSDKDGDDHSNELFEAEVEKFRRLKERYDDMDKSLRKRERDVTRLKRENKDLRERLEGAEKDLAAAAESAAKRETPGEYEVLEKLFEAELEKNERLKLQLSQKDKTVKKGMRDLSKLKRGKGSDDNRVEELETMVNDLALELMDYKDRERARKSLSGPQA